MSEATTGNGLDVLASPDFDLVRKFVTDHNEEEPGMISSDGISTEAVDTRSRHGDHPLSSNYISLSIV